MIADLYFVRPGAGIATDWRPTAFIAWAVGSLVAYGVETFAPQFSTAVSAFVAAGLCYLAIALGRQTVGTPAVPAAKA